MHNMRGVNAISMASIVSDWGPCMMNRDTLYTFCPASQTETDIILNGTETWHMYQENEMEALMSIQDGRLPLVYANIPVKSEAGSVVEKRMSRLQH